MSYSNKLPTLPRAMILSLASATTHRRQIIQKKGTKLRYYVLTTRLWTQPKYLGVKGEEKGKNQESLLVMQDL
jgi:hypothetical protein